MDNNEEKNYKVTIELDVIAPNKEYAIEYALMEILRTHKIGHIDKAIVKELG